MNNPRPKILLVLAALAALLVAGCGGGGGDTESTAATTSEERSSLSKAALISQGDAICAEVNAAVGALGGAETETVGGEAEKVANLYTGMVGSLQNLGAPEGEEGAYAQFSEAAEELAKVEGEVKLAAEREDTAALEEAEAGVEPALEEFQTAAAAYGFEDCGEGPSAPTVTPGTGGSSGEEAGGEYEEEGGVEAEPEYVEPEFEEEAAPEEVAPETGGAGGGEVAPEPAPEGGGSESGGVGPG